MSLKKPLFFWTIIVTLCNDIKMLLQLLGNKSREQDRYIQTQAISVCVHWKIQNFKLWGSLLGNQMTCTQIHRRELFNSWFDNISVMSQNGSEQAIDFFMKREDGRPLLSGFTVESQDVESLKNNYHCSYKSHFSNEVTKT